MDALNRRAFLAGTGALLTGAAVNAGEHGESAEHAEHSHEHPGSQENVGRRGNPIAVSTYSFWRFKSGMKMPIVKCIDEAARMGFDAVDVLLIQIEDQSKAALNKIKRHALINGLDLCCMSTHQGYVYPDKAKRQENIDLTIKQIEIGQTSKGWVLGTFGEPTSETGTPEGTEILKYVYTKKVDSDLDVFLFLDFDEQHEYRTTYYFEIADGVVSKFWKE